MTPEERFLSHVVCEVATGCWLWIGSQRQPDRYGDFWLNGKHEYAHRASYILFVGPIPPGALICHKDDCNKLCVRAPDHLYAGTKTTNAMDMIKADRYHRASMSIDTVRKITAAYATCRNQSELARHFKVGRTAVHRIVNGYTWKGVV